MTYREVPKGNVVNECIFCWSGWSGDWSTHYLLQRWSIYLYVLLNVYKRLSIYLSIRAYRLARLLHAYNGKAKTVAITQANFPGNVDDEVLITKCLQNVYLTQMLGVLHSSLLRKHKQFSLLLLTLGPSLEVFNFNLVRRHSWDLLRRGAVNLSAKKVVVSSVYLSRVCPSLSIAGNYRVVICRQCVITTHWWQKLLSLWHIDDRRYCLYHEDQTQNKPNSNLAEAP